MLSRWRETLIFQVIQKLPLNWIHKHTVWKIKYKKEETSIIAHGFSTLIVMGFSQRPFPVSSRWLPVPSIFCARHCPAYFQFDRSTFAPCSCRVGWRLGCPPCIFRPTGRTRVAIAIYWSKNQKEEMKQTIQIIQIKSHNCKGRTVECHKPNPWWSPRRSAARECRMRTQWYSWIPWAGRQSSGWDPYDWCCDRSKRRCCKTRQWRGCPRPIPTGPVSRNPARLARPPESNVRLYCRSSGTFPSSQCSAWCTDRICNWSGSRRSTPTNRVGPSSIHSVQIDNISCFICCFNWNLIRYKIFLTRFEDDYDINWFI